jgi:hypothetical protein
MKCKHCKKERGNHQANTLHCPAGIRTGIGYIHYSEQVYSPKYQSLPETIFFDLNYSCGYIDSYEALKDVIVSLKDYGMNKLEAVTYILDSYYSCEEYDTGSGTVKGTPRFTYNLNEITFRQYAEEMLDKQELAKVGITL